MGVYEWRVRFAYPPYERFNLENGGCAGAYPPYERFKRGNGGCASLTRPAVNATPYVM